MDKQIIQEINKMKEAGIQCDVKPGQPLKGANRYKKLYHFTSFNSFVKIWLSKKLLLVCVSCLALTACSVDEIASVNK